MLSDILQLVPATNKATDMFEACISRAIQFYKSYTTLYTDEEREEIFCMIGKVNGFKSKWFIGEVINKFRVRKRARVQTLLRHPVERQ